MTVSWWTDLWASATAPEYSAMHVHSLYRKALLVNEYWCSTDLKDRLNIEVRLEKAEADFGLNPMALRRLEWQIEATEDSKAKGAKRKAAAAAPAPPGPVVDPRLKLVQ